MNIYIHRLLAFKDYQSYSKIELINKCWETICKINSITKLYQTLSFDLILHLDKAVETSKSNKQDFAEVSSPIDLLKIISENISKKYICQSNAKFLDYSCGKGNIVLIMFLKYYQEFLKEYEKSQYQNYSLNLNRCDYYSYSIKEKICRHICEKCIYYADINPMNVFITTYKLKSICKLLCKKDDFNFNFSIGDSFKLNTVDVWNVSKFDIIFVNPPFEDRNNRNKTPHKLWIDFTIKTFREWLQTDGFLIQISPASFSSPSSKIIQLFRDKNIKEIHFNQEKYFKNISISITWYIIQNNSILANTNVNNKYSILINDKMLYIPNDCNPISLSIHKKVMFDTIHKLKIEKDYVTCHNIRIKEKNPPLSKVKTNKHVYPVFHTNKQIWYSSIKQNFSHCKKVMWTRSGYTKPFYDKEGTYGVTDLGYFVKVSSDKKGINLNYNLNQKLFTYILKTAKWSGFGNDKVFSALPSLPNKKLLDDELFDYFKLTTDERKYIIDSL